MADREKVIREFELFIRDFHPACTSECVELDMFREVLALLKKQEEEIKFLKAVQSEMVKNMDYKELGEIVWEKFRMFH